MLTSGLSLFTSQDLSDLLLLKPAPTGNCAGGSSGDLNKAFWPDSCQRTQHDFQCRTSPSDTADATRGPQQIPTFSPCQPSSMALAHPSEIELANQPQQSLDSPLVKQEPAGLSTDARSSAEQQTLVSSPHASQDNKKVGRPIAYKGDPNDSSLTEPERRRIKRRIANRESARRVRARRQETLEELQHRMAQISGQNTEMIKHIQNVQTQTVLMKGQLQECQTHWQQAMADNQRLQQHLGILTQRLQGKVPEGAKLKTAIPNTSWGLLPDQATAPGATSTALPHHSAPLTNISTALIDELPLMAMPLPD